jgi:hypothetical protein
MESNQDAIMNLAMYSLGIGDRFSRQGKAQLAAIVKARDLGVTIAPVWNKSNREHQIVGSKPADVRAEADAAAKALGWTGPYHVDADHIGLKTVDGFLAASDFFTLDVADVTGTPADAGAVADFVRRHSGMAGTLRIPGLASDLAVTPAQIEAIARKYLLAVQEAGRIHRRIRDAKGAGTFVTEVSMDETDQPQTPVELLFILAAIADERIPAQTLAPKFTGRFNKGIDYVGDGAAFEREFNDDLAVISFAVRAFGLPPDLKLSVHSGSDKFSIYRPIREAIRRHGAGLPAAGGEGLAIAKDVYAGALARFDALCAPYATVIDIDRSRLPAADAVRGWGSEAFVSALRHDAACPAYNPHLRQLLHVAYRLAAEMGARYLDALARNEAVVAKNVTENLFERHIRRLFL